jgi:transposase
VLDIEHERDIERLRRLALLQKSQLEHLVAVLARKCAELAKLKGGEDELQLTLKLLEDAQKQVAEADALTGRGQGGGGNGEKKEREPQTGHGPTEQMALERVSLLCELDDADRVCPSCSGQLEPLKGQAECSEMIDVVELKYQVVQVERQKYVCKCGSVVETAPGPERAVDGGRYSLRFAIKVAFDKYVAHLPLERQARLMAHAGLEITSQTLWDQCWAATRLLEPVYDALFQRLRAGPVIGVDQTSWPDLEDKTLPPWQMWCLTAPAIVYHRICDDKSAATFKHLLGDYRGWVVADALGTHEAGARECRGIKLAACWAHVLRRFRDAVVDFPEAQLMLAWIGDLYRIDGKATTAEERRRLRKAESREVLQKMRNWLLTTREPKTTSLGGAIRYTLRIWSRLTAFVDAPEVWLDNNATERGLRGPVIGRRNHFGSKSARGTQMAAILYTLVETAKVSGVDPIAYLVEAATRAKRSPGTVLLPSDFKAAPAQ